MMILWCMLTSWQVDLAKHLLAQLYRQANIDIVDTVIGVLCTALIMLANPEFQLVIWFPRAILKCRNWSTCISSRRSSLHFGSHSWATSHSRCLMMSSSSRGTWITGRIDVWSPPHISRLGNKPRNMVGSRGRRRLRSTTHRLMVMRRLLMYTYIRGSPRATPAAEVVRR